MSFMRKLSKVTPSGTLVPSSNTTAISATFTSLPGAILLPFTAAPEDSPRAVLSSTIFTSSFGTSLVDIIGILPVDVFVIFLSIRVVNSSVIFSKSSTPFLQT